MPSPQDNIPSLRLIIETQIANIETALPAVKKTIYALKKDLKKQINKANDRSQELEQQLLRLEELIQLGDEKRNAMIQNLNTMYMDLRKVVQESQPGTDLDERHRNNFFEKEAKILKLLSTIENPQESKLQLKDRYSLWKEIANDIKIEDTKRRIREYSKGLEAMKSYRTREAGGLTVFSSLKGCHC